MDFQSREDVENNLREMFYRSILSSQPQSSLVLGKKIGAGAYGKIFKTTFLNDLQHTYVLKMAEPTSIDSVNFEYYESRDLNGRIISSGYKTNFEDEVVISVIAGRLAEYSYTFFCNKYIFSVTQSPNVIIPTMMVPLFETDLFKFIQTTQSSYYKHHQIEFILCAMLHALSVMQNHRLIHRDLKTQNVFLEEITDETMWDGIKFRDVDHIVFDFGQNRKFGFDANRLQYFPKIGDWGIGLCDHPNIRIGKNGAEFQDSYPYCPNEYHPLSDLLMLVADVHTRYPTNTSDAIIKAMLPHVSDDRLSDNNIQYQESDNHRELIFIEGNLKRRFALGDLYKINYTNNHPVYTSANIDSVVSILHDQTYNRYRESDAPNITFVSNFDSMDTDNGMDIEFEMGKLQI